MARKGEPKDDINVQKLISGLQSPMPKNIILNIYSSLWHITSAMDYKLGAFTSPAGNQCSTLAEKFYTLVLKFSSCRMLS